CLDGSNHVINCPIGANSLQAAYVGGNTITTTDARDIAFTLADTTTDADFTVQTAAGATGSTTLSLADGANPTPPSQLLLISNLDVNQALPAGIKIQSAAGGITTGIDLTDSHLETALAIGTNSITGTNFTVTGTGDITAAGN